MKNTIIIIFVSFLLLWACNKESSPEGDPSQKLNFQSLTTDKDTIVPGESTQIKAIATGYMLDYYWTATAGDILGSGATVTYVTSPCQIGVNQITCEVKDGNNESQTKTITIVVQ